MSVVWVTSDWHLGHRNVAKWRETFTDPAIPADEHDQTILARYREAVKPRDMVWFLGDIILHPDYLETVAQLPGLKKLVLGNHDTDRLARGVTTKDLVKVFAEVHGLVSYKRAWLSHAPIHPQELRGKVNIHGHTHINPIKGDARYIPVCLEDTNFRPIKFQDIMRDIRNNSGA